MIFNNKKTKISSLFLSLICVLIFTGCEDDFLDKAESGGMTEEEIFGDYVQTQSFLANIYGDGIGRGDWMPLNSFTYAAASDEAVCPYLHTGGPQNFNNGTLSPTNNPVDVWGGRYQHIRKVNQFLQKIDAVPVDDNNQLIGRDRMKGEAYFLRAWFYTELFKRYGGVPILDRPLTIDEDLNIPRSTTDEIVDFIVSDCDKASELLPPTYTADNLGRATKGAAMMLKAQTLLFAASPLHNPENDIEKWKAAAAASQAVIDLNVYSLDDDYQNMLHTRASDEIIFQSTINQVWQVSSLDWVRQVQPPSQGGGWASVHPTENLVSDYEMISGLPITDPASGYDPNNPYVDRDPRFYQSIIYNNSDWAGSIIKTHVGGGVDGLNNGGAATKTGYYLGGKMLDENSTLISSYRPGSHYWVFMRYAETLLDYAEAQNEAYGPDPSVYDAVNLVRGRTSVEMPPLPAGLSKEGMRERIRNERRVELAFEGNRFWDVRRWRTGEEEFDAAYGMRITLQSGNYQYEKFLVEDRIYKPAFNLFPIPLSEMERNAELVQNPGY